MFVLLNSGLFEKKIITLCSQVTFWFLTLNSKWPGSSSHTVIFHTCSHGLYLCTNKEIPNCKYIMHTYKLQLQGCATYLVNPLAVSKLISVKGNITKWRHQASITYFSRHPMKMIHKENLTSYLAKFSQLWLASWYMWMSNALSVFTHRKLDIPYKQTWRERYAEQGCRGICKL